MAETQLGCKLSEAQGRAKRRLRAAVTGNPDKKVELTIWRKNRR